MPQTTTDEFEHIDLASAIAGLYAAFSGYGLVLPMNACDHCVSEDDQRLLASKPLRDLTSEDVSFYSFKAMTTFGTVYDFKHFLPRVFELVATDPKFGVNPEIAVGGKLEEADWHSWPEGEQMATESYLRAFWRDTLTRFPSVVPVDACLGSIAHAVDDLTPFLCYWEAAVERDRPGRLHLAQFVCDSIRPLREDRVLGAFWECHPERSQQVSKWLLNSAVAPKVEQSLREFVRAPEGQERGYALEDYCELLLRRE